MAAVVLVRRDVMVDGLSDPWIGEFGVEASNEVWLGRFKKQRSRKDDWNKEVTVGLVISAL